MAATTTESTAEMRFSSTEDDDDSSDVLIQQKLDDMRQRLQRLQEERRNRGAKLHELLATYQKLYQSMFTQPSVWHNQYETNLGEWLANSLLLAIYAEPGSVLSNSSDSVYIVAHERLKRLPKVLQDRITQEIIPQLESTEGVPDQRTVKRVIDYLEAHVEQVNALSKRLGLATLLEEGRIGRWLPPPPTPQQRQQPTASVAHFQ